MSTVKWGILSTAGIAQKALIPAFQRSSNAEVVAIASGSGIEKAQAVAEKFNIEKAYDSYEKLLADPAIDGVYIPLPNHLHKEWVMEAAKRGKHILCEKPAALNTEDVREMKKVCEEHNVILMEAFMYHFHPQHERVKQIIDAGEIGEVKYMRSGFSFNLDEKVTNIRMSDQKGGGSIYDIGCYAIHSIRNVLRLEPESIHAHAVKDPEYNVDTDVVAYLTLPNGVRASFDVSFNLVARDEYEVYGTNGKITVSSAYRPDLQGDDGIVVVKKQGVTRTETINGDQYRNEVEHISEAILTGNRKLKHDLENTINNMRVIDASFESMETGETIKLA